VALSSVLYRGIPAKKYQANREFRSISIYPWLTIGTSESINFYSQGLGVCPEW
jgi:hypothetical protein